MSLIRMRETILRPAALRKTMLLLAVVGALVAGLLAMHTVASGMGDHNDASSSTMTSTMAMQGSVHPAGGMVMPQVTSTGASDCTGTCDPGHAMATMACVLALLITILVLGALRSPARWGLVGVERPLLRKIIAFAAIAFRLPPSLDALSISRT